MEINENAMYKIDLLVEENLNTQQSVAKYRPISDTLTMVPGIGVGGNIAQGYTVGKELGHPVAGLLGAEVAAGAKSKHDNSVSINDVYTRQNMAKRGVQGGVLGLGYGAIGSTMQKNLVDNYGNKMASLDKEYSTTATDSTSASDYTKNLVGELKDGSYWEREAAQSIENPLEYAGEEGLAAAAGGALLAPGLKYGFGKIVGGRNTNGTK